MSPENNEEMRPEYDIRGGVRGKYFGRTRGREGPQASLSIQPPETESTGTHQISSTLCVAAESVNLTLRLEAVEPAR